MGVSGGSESRKGSPVSLGFRFLTRKKQVDSAAANTSGLLAKELTIPHLIAVGVGATIGAGVYVLVGTVARENAGPALTLSFLIAGIAAGLSAFCYAELASRCPSAGSAYHYSYICLGEGVAWIVGWALILEYTIGSSAVARGVSPNLAALCGGADNLPFFLSRQHIPGIDLIVDPCAAILVFVVTGLLCWGVKESTVIQGVVTTVNVCALLFVVVAGGYLGFKSGWVGYNLPTGYFPFGVNGMLAGSATVFFAYIGFDAVASTAEEVKNPQRDLPLGIAGALFLCCGLYMLVCIVVVGLVPYYLIDPDTPISSAFANNGMQWAGYIINAGAFTALCSALMGGLLPQPRILMAMARDGLLPTFFSDINKRTQVPIKSTIATGIAAAALAFFMDVDAMAGMVSVGTLLAFTMVAVSVLILRYIPPVDVPLSRSLQDSIETVSLRYRLNNAEPSATSSLIKADTSDRTKPLVDKDTVSKDHPPVTAEHFAIGNYMKIGNRRSVAGWAIALTCIGSFVLTFAASNLSLPSFVRYPLCGVGVIVLLCCLVFLSLIEQDDARHNFGYSGGFVCPFVPLLPIACILINFYLLVSLGLSTWLRVSVWLGVGVLVYVFYGRTHSSLKDAIYVPATRVEEIYTNARSTVA